jgi:hypothetical protein
MIVRVFVWLKPRRNWSWLLILAYMLDILLPGYIATKYWQGGTSLEFPKTGGWAHLLLCTCDAPLFLNKVGDVAGVQAMASLSNGWVSHPP